MTKRRFLLSTIERRANTEAQRLMRGVQKFVAKNRKVPVNFDDALHDLITDTAMFAMSAGIGDMRAETLKLSFEREIFQDIPVSQYEGLSAYLLHGATGLASKMVERIRFALMFAVNELRAGNFSYGEANTLVRKRLEEIGAAPSNLYGIATLLTTATYEPYYAQKYFEYRKPEIWNNLWGFRYVTKNDEKVRPNHFAQHNVTLPKDDPFWEVWWPPNGFNCRCEVEALYGKHKIKRPDEDFQPDDNFGMLSPKFNLTRPNQFSGVMPNVRFSLSTSDCTICS